MNSLLSLILVVTENRDDLIRKFCNKIVEANSEEDTSMSRLRMYVNDTINRQSCLLIESFSFVMTLAIDKNCYFLLINIDDGLNTINYIHVVYRVSVFLCFLYVIVMPGNNQRILTDSRSLIGVFLSYVDVLVSLTCTAIATLNKYM